LLISRRDSGAGRYVTNEDELAGKLILLGFERLVMSELNPIDQINAFRQAELIVLPHGAAGSFLPFCPADCKLIELHTPKLINGVFYAHWTMQRRPYGYIIGEGQAIGLDYWIDPKKTCELISVAEQDQSA
jgi:capsular polysaccharide biosynthesis protein